MLVARESALRDLEVLLADLFDKGELNRLVAELGLEADEARELVNDVNWDDSLGAVVHELVAALRRRGCVHHAFFDVLLAARGRRRAEIEALRRVLIEAHQGRTLVPKLPVHIGEFRGRKKEIGQCMKALDRASLRVLTLLGPPGIGKTSLAIEVTRRYSEHPAAPPGGIWWIRLRDSVTLEDILDRVGESLPVSPEHRAVHQRAAAVGAWLAQRPQMLLVLDHCDACAEPLAELLEDWLMSAPGLRVMCTSITALGARRPNLNAWALQVEGLEMREAEGLFRDLACLNAAIARRDLPAADVRELVQRVDGYPLALQVLAHMLGTQTLADLLAAVGRHSPGSGLDEALRAAWELLDPDARQVLNRLAVFPDGFLKSVALSVVYDANAVETLRGPILQLADKSLIRNLEVHGLPTLKRYYLLAPVRSFAFACLDEVGEVDAITRRFMESTLKHAEMCLARLRSREWRAAHYELRSETGNLTEVVAKGTAEQAARAALAIDAVFAPLGAVHRSIEVLTAALGRSEALSGATRMRLLLARASACLFGRSWSEAAPDLSEAEAILFQERELPRDLKVSAWRCMAVQARKRGQLREAERYVAEGRAWVNERVARHVVASLDAIAGDLAADRGDLIAAVELYGEALCLLDQDSNVIAAATAHRSCAEHLMALGHLDEARLHLEPALLVARSLEARSAEGSLEQSLGSLHLDAGALDEADRHLAAAEDVYRVLEISWKIADVQIVQGIVLLDRGRPVFALELFERAQQILSRAGLHPLLATLMVNQAIAYLMAGRPGEARRVVTEAWELKLNPRALTSAYLYAYEAVALAADGALEDGLARMDRAEVALPTGGDPANIEVFRTLRILLPVVRARGDAGDPEDLTVAQARLRAVAPGGELAALARRSSDLRIAGRLLERALAQGVQTPP